MQHPWQSGILTLDCGSDREKGVTSIALGNLCLIIASSTLVHKTHSERADFVFGGKPNIAPTSLVGTDPLPT